MRLLDTIAAVSTPRGKGGIAVIRISGEDAFAVCDTVFFPACQAPLSQLTPAKMYYGEIRMPSGEEVDSGMAVRFAAPRSFTGENTVEISCHGGALVTKKVLSAVLAAGARAAEAGEFTRRAYVNGKMRLSEAEALGDLLEAKSEAGLSLARNGMKGLLGDRIDSIYDELKRTLTSVYAVIDFPDEDLSEMSREEITAAVKGSGSAVKALAATYGTGRAVNEGVRTVICGRTNAGKSSVYNRILGYDAAIVTDIEGTTRDVLRERATLGSTLLLLCDTAGLRETGDKVESIGIERTRSEIADAELILAVFDGSKPLTDEDMGLLNTASASGATLLILVNKTDLGICSETGEALAAYGRCISISAKSGEGFDVLAETIDDAFIDGEIDIKNDPVVTGARQYAALTYAAEALDEAARDLELGVPLDLCCVAVESALTSLGEVDGRELGEEIVAEIFSRFCVGK